MDKAHPLTLDIYQQMEDVQKTNHRRPRFWVGVGGLKVQQRGYAAKRMDALNKKYSTIAMERALQARKEAGWKGWRHRTSPDGKRAGPSGQGFGPYTMPGAEYNRGVWDGILKPDQTFTV